MDLRQERSEYAVSPAHRENHFKSSPAAYRTGLLILRLLKLQRVMHGLPTPCCKPLGGAAAVVMPPLVIRDDSALSVGDPAQHWQVVSQSHKVPNHRPPAGSFPPPILGALRKTQYAHCLPSQQKYAQRTATMSGGTMDSTKLRFLKATFTFLDARIFR
jgi:hypothetical protein